MISIWTCQQTSLKSCALEAVTALCLIDVHPLNLHEGAIHIFCSTCTICMVPWADAFFNISSKNTVSKMSSDLKANCGFAVGCHKLYFPSIRCHKLYLPSIRCRKPKKIGKHFKWYPIALSCTAESQEDVPLL